jgi:VanZ family protein
LVHRAFLFGGPVLFLPATKLQLKKKKAIVWLALTWLILVTILLCLPGGILPKKNWLNKIFFDKWVHIFLFAMLNIFWLRFAIDFRGKKIRLIIITTGICVLYGISMEFVQEFFIPNRSFNVGDIAADIAGSIIGAFVVGRYIKK